MFNKPNLFHGTGEVSAQRNAQRMAGTNVAAVPVTPPAETGGSAALPMWIGYMARALKDVPESFMPQPEGLVALDAVGGGKGPSKEFFYKENVPQQVEEEPPQDPNAKPVD